MSSISGIGSVTASSYAVAQSGATRPQPEVPTQSSTVAKSSAGVDVDGDGDHDGGSIDISG